jgi:hypothetical protein
MSFTHTRIPYCVEAYQFANKNDTTFLANLSLLGAEAHVYDNKDILWVGIPLMGIKTMYPGDWIVKSGDQIQLYTDESFKSKFRRLQTDVDSY